MYFSRDPNKGGNLKKFERVWSPYTVEKREHIVINTSHPIIKHGLRNRQCLFWGQHLPELRAEINSMSLFSIFKYMFPTYFLKPY